MAFIIFAVLIIISIIEFTLIQDQFNTIANNGKFIKKAYQRYFYIIQIPLYVRSILSIAQSQPLAFDKDLSQIQELLAESVRDLYEI